MAPAIRPSARKHGITDDDILHAYRNAFDVRRQLGMTMWIGGDRAGRVLEIGVVLRDCRPAVVHAMRARRKYWPGAIPR